VVLTILTQKLEIKWMSLWKLQKKLFHKYFYQNKPRTRTIIPKSFFIILI
jgi:hypothetical protein